MTNSNKSSDNNTTGNVLSAENENTDKVNAVEDTDNTTDEVEVNEPEQVKEKH